MSVIRINKTPDPRQLRQFGWIWMIFFTGLGATLGYRTGEIVYSLAVWLPAWVLGLAGFAAPALMRGLYLILSYLTFPIGFVLSYALLAAIYFLVVTPIGLLLKVLGKDPLQRGIDRSKETYWEELPENRDPGSYFKQF